MANKAAPDWHVWFNIRGEEFCQGQQVNVHERYARSLPFSRVEVSRASRSYICLGCNGHIMEGDLYGRSTTHTLKQHKYCLNCCTVEEGVYGDKAEPLDDALERFRLGLLSKPRKTRRGNNRKPMPPPNMT